MGGGSPLVKKEAEYFPEAPASNVVRIVPLGGVEEVGRNMFTVETNGDIFIFDVGFQFVSEDTSPGVDYVLPNTKYLEKNIERVRAVFITHGHLDHIGGSAFFFDAGIDFLSCEDS
jgi:ribonuclease J